MNEVLMAEDDPKQSSHEAPAEAGAMLRGARDAAGLRIEVLAASLKVPVAKLVALEAGDLSALPDRVFVRALVAGICRHLKVAPEPILAKLPLVSRVERPMSVASTGRSAVRLNQGRQSPSVREWMSRPRVWGVLLLLLGALVMVFWPQVRAWGDKVMVSHPSLPQAVAPVVTPVQAPPAVSVVSAASAAMPEPAVVTPPVAVPVAATAANSTEWLVLQAKGEAWVRVTDAQNAVVLQKTMVAGEAANLSARPPLSVVIGRADVVDVRLRGIPKDLSASGSKVARFVAQ